MSYSWLQDGAWHEGYAPPPEMPPPGGDDGYGPPPSMPGDRGYAPPPEMPPVVTPPTAQPKEAEEAGMGIGWHALIVVGIFGGLGYYYFLRR